MIKTALVTATISFAMLATASARYERFDHRPHDIGHGHFYNPFPNAPLAPGFRWCRGGNHTAANPEGWYRCRI